MVCRSSRKTGDPRFGNLPDCGAAADCGYGLGAGAQGNPPLEIAGGVNLVRNFAAVTVEVVLARSPTGGVPLGDDAMNAASVGIKGK